MSKENFEQRKEMWFILSKLFYEVHQTDFIWMYSEDDKEVACMHSDGMTHGVVGMSKSFSLHNRVDDDS